MRKIVECVPNFSEGRDKSILDQIVAEINSVEGSQVVDVDMGADTNRTVVTFFGSPESVQESAFLAIKKAAELIDMSQHKGAHPRMGATDVCPFIPVSGVTMQECVEISKKVGKRVGDELGIPIFLYEESASRPEWRNLANIREGEYEALEKKFRTPEFTPDFGPKEFRPKVGATAMSAREFLIAYNINLNTKDKKLAFDIASDIREKGRVKRTPSPTKYYRDGEIIRDENGKKTHIPGVFKHCKAIGWYIPEYGRAQISINLTNYKITPIHDVYDYVVKAALDRGLQVTGSEIVGLVPKAAMVAAGKHYLQRMGKPTGLPERELVELAAVSMGLSDIAPFDIDERVVEYVLAEKCGLVDMTVSDFVDEVQTDSVAPGGGSVSALGGALGAGLVAMVSNLSGGKDFLEIYPEICQMGEIGEELKAYLVHGIDADTNAFNGVIEANKIKASTPEEEAAKDAAILEAYKGAINVPYGVAEKCLDVLRLAKQLAPKGLAASASDVGVGALMANAGMHGAILNVKINMPEVKDEAYKTDMLAKCAKVAEEGDQLLKEILAIVEERM